MRVETDDENNREKEASCQSSDLCFSNIKTLNLHDELIEHRRVQPRMQALMGSINF